MDPEVTAGLIGFGGSLVGGTIAALVSLRVARVSLQAAERDWIRESRRALYDHFLDAAQSLLIACDASSPDKNSIADAHSRFFQAYARVQLVAKPRVVQAARSHAYRLWELEHEVLGNRPVLDPQNAEAVSRSVRDARHDTIEAMREDLDPTGKPGPVKPREVYNPFAPPDGTAELGDYLSKLEEYSGAGDYLSELEEAYRNELKAAHERSRDVRPGWEGSRYASGTSTGQGPGESPGVEHP
jgi:hypothetical protein